MNPLNTVDNAINIVTFELDKATRDTVQIIGDTIKPISDSIVSIANKITSSDCKFGISGGISLLTGTPDVTIGFTCSDGKTKS